MVRRVYVEKKNALRQEAAGLLNELRSLLGISALTGLRLINRYDVEGLDEATFQRAVQTVFSEPQVDDATAALPAGDDCRQYPPAGYRDSGADPSSWWYGLPFVDCSDASRNPGRYDCHRRCRR